MADVSPNAPPPPPAESEPPPSFTAPPMSVTDKQPSLTPAVSELQGNEPAAVSEPEKPQQKKLPPESLISFKEESSKVGDLSDNQKKALEELKQLVKEAAASGELTPASPPPPPQEQLANVPEKKEKQEAEHATIQEVLAAPAEAPAGIAFKSESEPAAETEARDVEEKLPEASESVAASVEDAVKPEESESESVPVPVPETLVEETVEEVSIWGVPLLKDERSDVILLKFLRARDFNVKEAFLMLKNTLKWRKEFGIDELVDEDLGDDLDKVVFMHGYDREGHLVCYNVFGEFQNKELYQATFSDAQKRSRFLRWRIQFLERSIRKLNFNPGGVSTMFQVNDLKNSPGPGKRELRLATKQALQLLQDNYPEFVAKQVFINVPWWYIAFYTMIGPFLTQRTKSKFVFVGPSKSAETLFKYISPEQVPIQYGGLSVDSCDCDPEFSLSDPVTEIAVKPTTKQTVEIIVSEKCIIIWEIRVVGWEVSYGAEFVPTAEDGYTVLIHKTTKMSPTDEPVISNSYKIDELGKIILTIDNPTSKRKKLLYRFKVKTFTD